MTCDEWDAAWTALRVWLRQRFIVDWIPRKGRQIYAWDTYDAPERTLHITICDVSVLTRDFSGYVQEGLKSGWGLWRVEVMTDDFDENTIMIYSDAIRINEEAE